MPQQFIKMHGTGNDFIVLDARARDIVLPREQIIALAHRQKGVGFDQCIILKTSTRADVFMQIINADGSEVNACGNASRCIGWLVANEKNAPEVTIETNAGLLQAKLAGNHRVSVNMGKPKLHWQDIPLSHEVNAQALDINIEGYDLPPGVCVNMGNPHVVFFVDKAAQIDLEKLGAELEVNPIFPERANISIARILDDSHIKLDVWERGAGITLSCGTAACATLVAAVQNGLVAPMREGVYLQLKNTNQRIDPRLRGDDVYCAEIQLPGGNLEISWDKNGTGDVWMTGAVAESFRGVLP